MDVVPGGVHSAGRVPVDVLHLAARTHQNQAVGGGGMEGDTPVEQPEVVGQFRVTGRHVAITELPPSHRSEDPVAGRHHLLAVSSLGIDVTHGVERLDSVESGILALVGRSHGHGPTVDNRTPGVHLG